MMKLIYFKNIVVKKNKNPSNKKNVIYMITNDPNKKKFIIGRTANLNKRLCNYNKSCKHTVIYAKEFDGPIKMLQLIEYMILIAMDPYRENLNIDRFILPDNKTIKFFTDIMDYSFDNTVNYYDKISNS